MNEDLKKFLKEHGVNNIEHFLSSMNSKILPIEKVISKDEFWYASFEQINEEHIPISKILGCSDLHLGFDKSFFENFKNFFNSNQNDTYHTRALPLLRKSNEEIMKVLKPSFEHEPIKTLSVGNNYYISENGLHRFILLKLFYTVELYQGKKTQDLNEKYQIKVLNKKYNIFKTFTHYFESVINPTTHYIEGMSEENWLLDIKHDIENIQDYQNFIITFSFTKFINGESGEIMIYMLYKYFPTILKDIIKYLFISNNYEYTTSIIECINKYFPTEKKEINNIITNYLFSKENQKKQEALFEFFDLQYNWNNYGISQDISKFSKEKRNIVLTQLSENSQTLEKCLKIIWNKGIETIASCKGNHLTITVDNKPEISCEAYIAFSNTEWLEYLSYDLIENEDVILTKNAIYYYGKNHDLFFYTLSHDFLLGKKENKELLNIKIRKQLSFVEKEKLEYKAFLFSLYEIGFTKDQITQLATSYLEIHQCMNEYYSLKEGMQETEILKKWHTAQENFDADLRFFISRNNRKEI